MVWEIVSQKGKWGEEEEEEEKKTGRQSLKNKRMKLSPPMFLLGPWGERRRY